MAPEKTEQKIDREYRFGKPWEWATGLFVGTASAAVTFVNSVQAKFLLDGSFREGFRAVTEHKNTSLAELSNGRINAAMGLFEQHLRGNPHFENFKEQRKLINLALGANNDWLNAPAVRAQVKPYNEALTAMFEHCGEAIDKISHSQAFKTLTNDYLKNVRETKLTHTANADRFADWVFGIRSGGVRGFLDGVIQRYNTFGPNSRRSIQYKTTAAFVGGLGIVAMVANQLNNRERLNDLDISSSNVHRKLDAIIDAQAESAGREIKVEGLLSQRARTTAPVASHTQSLAKQREQDAVKETVRSKA